MLMIAGVKVKKLKIADKNRARTIYEITSLKKSKCNKHIGYIKFKPNAKFMFHFHKDLDETYVPIEGKLVLFLYDARKRSKTLDKSMEIVINAPTKISIPHGVEHAYLNPTKKKSHMILLSNHHWHKRYNIVDVKRKKDFLDKCGKYKG
jgi:dTDP-4-dehydrorhamnose 3,5-epimerase-like enzyme